MSNKTIFIQGTAEVTVPATESISISNYGGGIAKIFYLIVTSNFPPAYQFQQAIENEGIILGPFAVATKVKIEALNSTVVYDIGASPSGGIGDAETLGGQPGSYYLDADNINAGTISDARLPGTISSDTTGNAATATDSDTLDGVQGSDYARISQINIFTANNFITKTTPLLQLTDDFDDRYFKISIYAGTHYLQFSGASGANGGDVYLTGADGAPAGTLYTNEGGSTYKFWHEGNDGSGSGLDADTVDGLQASSFVRKDAVNNGAITIKCNDAEFIIQDTTDVTTNYFWRDWAGGYLYIGSPTAVLSLRSDVYISNNDLYLGNAKQIYVKESGGTDRSALLMTSGNVITVGSTSNATNIRSNGTLLHNGIAMPLLGSTNTWSGTNTFTTNTTDFQAILQSRNNLLVGVDGEGDSFIQFWDDTNNAYRSMGWDDTNHYWFMEDSGGTNRQIWTAAENASVGAGSGVTGSFTTSDAKTVTVTNGIITSIV